MLVGLFPQQFKDEWGLLSSEHERHFSPDRLFQKAKVSTHNSQGYAAYKDKQPLVFSQANDTRAIYTVKDVQLSGHLSSRLEFVTPPKRTRLSKS